MVLLLALEINGWVLALIIGVVLYIMYGLSFKAGNLRSELKQRDLKDVASEAANIVRIERLIQEHEGTLAQKELIIEGIKNEQDGLIVQKDLIITGFKNEIVSIQNEMNLKANEKGQELASIQFQKWKAEELNKYIKIIESSSIEKAQAMLNQWKIDNEDRIRKDAANRSVRNVLGKVIEHLIPFSEALKAFNPKDIRFIGSPIDLIIFDGSEELNKDQIKIYFVEVKTGTSTLSKRQQMIKDAVQNRRVGWIRVNMKSFGQDVNEALSQ